LLLKKRFFLAFVSLAFWRTGPWRRFDVDHASDVSFLSFRLTAIFPKYVLMVPSSFAIWNMQKLVVAFSIAVWVTNITLMLVCELRPSIL
jgi:hypothetical protein